MLKSKITTTTSTTTGNVSAYLLDVADINEALGNGATIKSIYFNAISDDSAKTITFAITDGVTDVVVATHSATTGTTYGKIENGDALVALTKRNSKIKLTIPTAASTKSIVVNAIVNYF